ncbi:MAG: tetratricopeptide repeat protein [Armatimonadetes bacterium]|nr:tetratricopeptide repeat protein [Armatimonadota bacterium]
MDPTLLKEALESNEQLLDQATRDMTDHRYDETILICQDVLLDNPSDTRAYALLGDAHERKGDYARALEAYEKVVELDPDSRLDKIKLAHLREVFVTEASHMSAPPSGRASWLAAAAAIVLVCSFGGAYMVFKPRPTVNPDSAQQNTMGNVATNMPDAGRNDPYIQQPATNPATATSSNGTIPQNLATNEGARAVVREPLPDARPTGAIRTNETDSEESSVRPMAPPVGSLEIRPTNPAPSVQPSVDPDPRPVGGSSPKKNTSPGIIEISPSRGSGNPASSGSNNTSRGGASDYLRQGREAMQNGDLKAAISAYENALSAGADSALTNQRLAQAYEAAGRRSEAIAAYRRAISALESRTASGGSESDKNRLETCRRALAVLGG